MIFKGPHFLTMRANFAGLRGQIMVKLTDVTASFHDEETAARRSDTYSKIL